MDRTLLRRVTAGLVLTLPVALAGCAGGSDATTVRYAAFHAENNWGETPFPAYFDAVTEASGGTLEFEAHYAGSLLSATELATGLADGIANLAHPIYAYDPASFPIDNWISALASQADPRPVVGALQSFAANLEWAYGQPEYMDEIAAAGLHPLLPRFQYLPKYDLICSQEYPDLDSLRGATVRVGGETWRKEAERLGMVPSQLPADEVYEALDRGVLDCFMGGIPDAMGLGVLDVAPYVVEANLTGWSSYGLAYGSSAWDGLTLEQQQALHDELRVYISGMLENMLGQYREFGTDDASTSIVLDKADAGVIDDYHAEVADTLGDSAPEQVSDPEATVDEYVRLHEEWLEVVLELGYDTGAASWADWAQIPADELDLDPFVDAVVERILDGHRPG